MNDPAMPPPSKLDTTIKAALRAIPYAGSSLSVIFEDSRARHGARVARFAEDVAHEIDVDVLAARLAEREDIEIIFLEGVEVVVRSTLAGKRRLLAKLVAKAAADDAKVEEAQLILQALRELDGPHLRALARLRLAENEARDRRAGASNSDAEAESVAAVVHQAGRNEPTPILSALIRTGVVLPATLVGGGVGVYGVSEFGRRLLTDLDQLNAWS